MIRCYVPGDHYDNAEFFLKAIHEIASRYYSEVR